MPQLQSMVLTDRASSPASRTFAPKGINPQTGVATLVETNGVPIGEPKFTISLKEGDRYRARLTLVVPVIQTATDSQGISKPVVIRSASVFADFVFAKDSTAQERKDLVGMFASSLAASVTLVDTTLIDLEGIY